MHGRPLMIKHVAITAECSSRRITPFVLYISSCIIIGSLLRRMRRIRAGKSQSGSSAITVRGQRSVSNGLV